MKVLVTDGNYRNALAAVRSLGRRGIDVVVGASTKFPLSFYSKYCREKVLCPGPKHEDEFVQSIIEYARRLGIDAVLPIGYLSNVALSKHKENLLSHTALPVADWDSMKIACNKDETMKAAESLGIKIPITYESAKQVDRFPVVVKAIKESGHLRYVNSREELFKTTVSDCLIQEYIPGEGYGFFALCNKGSVRIVFMHKRIREFPITGGPSTAAESIYDPELKDMAVKLLEGLNWHGVAMVEFKKDRRDGEFKLMEVNPKFWGSLDLSIASGVDFPYFAVKMALDGDIEPVSDYKVGLRFRWPFPYDVLHMIANPKSLPQFIGEIVNPNAITNFAWGDIKPNLYQMLSTGPIMLNRMRKGGFRHPHGVPKSET